MVISKKVGLKSRTEADDFETCLKFAITHSVSTGPEVILQKPLELGGRNREVFKWAIKVTVISEIYLVKPQSIRLSDPSKLLDRCVDTFEVLKDSVRIAHIYRPFRDLMNGFQTRPKKRHAINNMRLGFDYLIERAYINPREAADNRFS
jgi:hypothetical protein